MNKDFDLVISNPPYEYGNKITSAIIENVSFDKFVNLMPLSCYKAKKLFTHVESLELVDPKAFTDVSITDNLNIAILNKEENDISWKEFELNSFDPKYLEFYKLNANRYHYAISEAALYGNPKAEAVIKRDKNIKASFAVTSRAVQGTHKLQGKGAFDIEWNIYKNKSFDDIHVAPQGGATIGLIYFNTETEQENLCKFWYKNPLQNALIKGMKKASGTCETAIPKIDWSIDRDYEHLTYEELLNIMREEIA